MSFVVPVEGKEDSEFVVGLERDVVHVVWDLKSNKPTATKVLCSAEEDRGRNRLNDGKVDPTGRLWAGKSNIYFSIYFVDKDLYFL